MKFRFIERNAPQNEFQGDKLQLKWKFEAQQGDGVEKYKRKETIKMIVSFSVGKCKKKDNFLYHFIIHFIIIKI